MEAEVPLCVAHGLCGEFFLASREM